MKKRLYIFSALLVMLTGSSCSGPSVDSGPVDKTPIEDPYFIHLSDVHLDSFKKTSKKDGSYTGTVLWSYVNEKLKDVLKSNPPPKFVLYSGDLPAHDPSIGDDHDTNISTILTAMRDLVSQNDIPFFYLPGNNDALAGNYNSFANGNQKTALSLIPEDANPYPALNTEKSCGNPPCMISKVHQKMGYYSAKPLPGLRLIALNSIILCPRYPTTPADGVDRLKAGKDQLDWLKDQLSKAESARDKVYIAMHIPPGIDAYKYSKGENALMWLSKQDTQKVSYQKEFLGMVEKYKATIAGILFGHTHMDEVRLLYDLAGSSVTEVAISAPGISLRNGNNPGFKRVYYNQASKELTDFVTYYTTWQASSWGSYRFSDTDYYNCKAGATIYECISSMTRNPQDVKNVNTAMNKNYTVKNSDQQRTLDYTKAGIPVKADQ